MQLHELYPAGLENTDLSLKKHPRFWAWRNFFLRCDRFLKLYESSPFIRCAVERSRPPKPG